MSATLAMARAQLGGRGGALLVAAVTGALPPLVPRVAPEWIGFGPNLVVLIWAATQLVALFIGFAAFGEDLASGRLAFFFHRGAPALGIWGARLGAAVAYALALQALILGPTLLSWPDDRSFAYGALRLRDTAPSLPQLALLTATLVCGGALAGILGRARGRWLALDAGAALAVLAAVAWAVREVARIDRAVWDGVAIGAPHYNDLYARIEALQTWAVAGALMAFAVSTAAAIVVGRGHPRRAPAAASIALWSTALPVVAACAVYIYAFLPAR